MASEILDRGFWVHGYADVATVGTVVSGVQSLVDGSNRW